MHSHKTRVAKQPHTATRKHFHTKSNQKVRSSLTRQPRQNGVITQQLRSTANVARRRVMVRPTSKLAVGIVGMPNIGKSLIFNCISDQQVPSENYPFCTIDPSSAIVPVPDDRLEVLRQLHKSENTIHSTLTITDIAGLVRGASEGKGLGNDFLSHIQAVDAIFHLVRLFPQPASHNVEHVEGSLDPIRDLEIISKELLLRDKKHLETQHNMLKKKAGRNNSDQAAHVQLAAAEKALDLVSKGIDVREGEFTLEEANALITIGLLTAKPIVYILNCSTEEYLQQYSPLLKDVRSWIKNRSPLSTSLLFSGDWEADLALTPKQDLAEYVSAMAEEYPLHKDAQPLIEFGENAEPTYILRQAMEKLNQDKSMIPSMVCCGYSSLDLIQYFTAGPMESRSWTIRRGFTAQESAMVIHSDFKALIAAEVINYDDFLQHKDEAVLRKLGKVQTQGKTYTTQDGDIMVFKIPGSK